MDEKQLKKFMNPYGTLMAKIVAEQDEPLRAAMRCSSIQDADTLGKAHFSLGIVAGIGVTLNYLKKHPKAKFGD